MCAIFFNASIFHQNCFLVFYDVKYVYKHDLSMIFVVNRSEVIVEYLVVLEHGSSAVECRTLSRESPGSNPFFCYFEAWSFLFSPRHPSSLGMSTCL